jgi:hypothetical protein
LQDVGLPVIAFAMIAIVVAELKAIVVGIMNGSMYLAAAMAVIVIGSAYLMAHNPSSGILGAIIAVGSLLAGWKIATTKGW